MMLITPTLLNAFRWYSHYMGEEPEDETIQRMDFLRMLNRMPMAFPGLQIEHGRKLEDDVVAYCNAKGYVGAPRHIKLIGDDCGFRGLWQQPVKRELDGFMLYGRVDHMFADRIIDIKWTQFYDIGKFVRSAQHRLYLYCSELERFRYWVSDDRGAWPEDYNNHASIESELRAMIACFMSYLEDDTEAKELYFEHWKAKS